MFPVVKLCSFAAHPLQCVDTVGGNRVSCSGGCTSANTLLESGTADCVRLLPQVVRADSEQIERGSKQVRGVWRPTDWEPVRGLMNHGISRAEFGHGLDRRLGRSVACCG